MTFDETRKRDFRSGNDDTRMINGTVSVQTEIPRQPLGYRSHMVSGGTPWLGSIALLRSVGAVIDFEENTGIFRRLDPTRVVNLRVLPTGHVAMPLNEVVGGTLETAEASPVLQELIKE